MLTNSRPKTILVIMVMLLVLALVSATSLITTRIGFGVPNRLPGAFPGGAESFQGDNNGAAGGNFQNRRSPTGFNLFSITRSLGLSPQLLIYVNIGLPLLGIALLLTSLYGIWKQKIWGLNLATLLGLIFLAGALPGLFSLGGRSINWLRIVTPILSAAATLPILLLSFLPSVRDYFPKPARKLR